MVKFEWCPVSPLDLKNGLGPEIVGAVLEIDMRKGSTDNELLMHIGKLNELRRLNLSSVSIDDEGLRLIAHLPLTELWLQSTQITDSAAETLSKMKTLQKLSLNATSLSDSFSRTAASPALLGRPGVTWNACDRVMA